MGQTIGAPLYSGTQRDCGDQGSSEAVPTRHCGVEPTLCCFTVGIGETERDDGQRLGATGSIPGQVSGS